MIESEPTYKVAIVAPTCFYYQAPIFRHLTAHPRIDVTVYFCSDEALSARDVVKLYKTQESWGVDEELLEGYSYRFLYNYSPMPSYLKTPFGLMNFGIWNEIKRSKPDVVVVMGWTNPTWWVAILASMRFKIPFLYMNDANVEAELSQVLWKSLIKRLALGRVLFRLAAGFLSSGIANDRLYEFYGVPREKLVPFAYSWVHETLLPLSNELRPQRDQIRAELGIPQESCAALFCGRLIKQKGLFQLLEAYQTLDIPNKALLLVGDGEARASLEDFVRQHNIPSVNFLGFQDRNDLPKFYAAADFLVLPSWRDTWGMVVNEALSFGLPVIVSDKVGAGDDLVIEGVNGFRFPKDDVEQLSQHMRYLMELPAEGRQAMGNSSLDIIKRWSEKDLAASLLQYLDTLGSGKGSEKRIRQSAA